MQSSTAPATHDRFGTVPDDHPEAPHQPFSGDEIPCAPNDWTLEDFRDILPGPLQ